MKLKLDWKIALAGAIAGTINGLFGAGGGLVLVPLLTFLSDLEEDQIFPASVSIIFPVCIISLLYRSASIPQALTEGLPYMLGGLAGGIASEYIAHKIPVKWLHRSLGILILWGGVKYLC